MVILHENILMRWIFFEWIIYMTADTSALLISISWQHLKVVASCHCLYLFKSKGFQKVFLDTVYIIQIWTVEWRNYNSSGFGKVSRGAISEDTQLAYTMDTTAKISLW